MSQQTPPPINPYSKSTAKGFVAGLSKTAGAATKLVGLQAERTKLTTLTLPAAYRALGNDCVQQKRHLDGVKELIEQLRTVTSELSSLAETPKADSSKQSLTDKAKAAGKQAVDFARRKQLEMKRESLCGDVGKAIYETHKESSGSKEIISPIQAALNRVAELDSEIAKLSDVGKGSWVTPKRMLVAAAGILTLTMISLLFSGNPSNRTDSSESMGLSNDNQQKQNDKEKSVSDKKYTTGLYAKLTKGKSETIAGGPYYTQEQLIQMFDQNFQFDMETPVAKILKTLGEPTLVTRTNRFNDVPVENQSELIKMLDKQHIKSLMQDWDECVYKTKETRVEPSWEPISQVILYITEGKLEKIAYQIDDPVVKLRQLKGKDATGCPENVAIALLEIHATGADFRFKDRDDFNGTPTPEVTYVKLNAFVNGCGSCHLGNFSIYPDQGPSGVRSRLTDLATDKKIALLRQLHGLKAIDVADCWEMSLSGMETLAEISIANQTEELYLPNYANKWKTEVEQLKTSLPKLKVTFVKK